MVLYQNFFLFFLIFGTLKKSNGQAKDGPRVSSCSNLCIKCEEFTIECKNLNATNTDLIKNPIQSIQTISFTGNNLKRLSETIFKYEMNALELLDLSDNRLNRIDNHNVFKNLPNLFELILDNNELDFNSEEEFSSMKLLSNSLERLSLNKAFTHSKVIDYRRALEIDKEIHNLLSRSQLNNVFELKLRENSLIQFNVKPIDSILEVNKDGLDSFKDILCLLPKLKLLYLETNLIESIDFDLNCLNENKTSSLELIHLESNKINTIDSNFISKLKIFSLLNSNFKINLQNNPFKCDCSLYPFYKWLLAEDSTGIVHDKVNLKCKHEDSFQATLNKPIVNSNLHSFCDSSFKTERTTTPGLKTYKKIYFPVRNRTSKTTKPPNSNSSFSGNKLFLFIFSALIISLVIGLLLRYHCKKISRKQQFDRYATLEDETFFNNSSIDGINLSTSNVNTSRMIFKTEENTELTNSSSNLFNKNGANNKNYLEKITNKLKKNQPIKSINFDISSKLPYGQFDQQKDQAESSSTSANSKISFNSIQNKKKEFKTKQLSSTEDSDKEEEIYMDAAVNNIRLKSNSKSRLIEENEIPKQFSQVLFVRTP